MRASAQTWSASLPFITNSPLAALWRGNEALPDLFVSGQRLLHCRLQTIRTGMPSLEKLPKSPRMCGPNRTTSLTRHGCNLSKNTIRTAPGDNQIKLSFRLLQYDRSVKEIC